MRRWHLHRDGAVLQKRGADGWWRTAHKRLERPHSPTQPSTLEFKLTVVVRVADIESKDGYACQLISGMRVYPPLRESWTRIEHLSGQGQKGTDSLPSNGRVAMSLSPSYGP